MGGTALMYVNQNRILQFLTGAAMTIAVAAGAQAPAPPAPASDPAPAAAPAAPAQAPAPPAAPPAAPTWSVGPMDISGLIDGYYSYNYNRPGNLANGQINDLYNFDDKTDQFNLAEARLTLNHDPDPVGAHVDLLFGRANTLINGPTTAGNETQFLEQAFVSLKPVKAKGLEMDFGKFVTSAGAEVIESKDNWNYSRSLLFAWAIPYFHFGLRTSMPVSKTDTIGVQVVNGWNNVVANNGGVTIGVTNALVKPKYTWNANYYGGPSNANTQSGYRNLFDTTLLLTPNAKFNAYINYDYGQNRDASIAKGGDGALNRWQGVAFAAHQQMTGTQALAMRGEYFSDPEGFSTGRMQDLWEITATYEYKWAEGLLSRIEYRFDKSNQQFFHKGDTGTVNDQSTLTAGFVAFFGPKR
jgi:hypothetical protein